MLKFYVFAKVERCLPIAIWLWNIVPNTLAMLKPNINEKHVLEFQSFTMNIGFEAGVGILKSVGWNCLGIG